MEENNYLVESFGNSIGADIAEFAGEAIEFTLDTCVGEDGILKDIPFVGTALKLCNITSKVQEKYSFYKLKAFIREINAGTASPEELEERKQKFLSKAEFRQQELEYILILIDRYVSFDKAKMLAKLYMAYLDDKIKWVEFTQYAEVLDRLLPGDIYLGKDGYTYARNKSDSQQRLAALGLLRGTVPNPKVDSGVLSFSSSALNYELTKFGRVLIDVLNPNQLRKWLI